MLDSLLSIITFIPLLGAAILALFLRGEVLERVKDLIGKSKD